MKKVLFLFFSLLMLGFATASATVWPRTYGPWSRLANGGTVKGTITIPVIFVNFSQANGDDANTVSDANQAAWINDLNATTGYGANKYFSDMSYGNANVQFVKVGTYTASGKASSFANTYVNLVSTAVQGVNYNNWDNFDSNSDGFVDMVLLIYAGHADSDYSSSSSKITSIYPASGWLDVQTGAGTTITSVANLKFSRYLYVNDLATYSSTRANLGTAIHELGHALFDLPDYYNKSSGSPSYGSNMGFWDTMDYGTFLGDVTSTPNPAPGLSAFSRMLNGWLTPRELTYGQHVTLRPLNNYADACIIKTDNANEYYLLEARHAASGSWDAGLASGLILTYVNEGKTASFIIEHGSNDGTVKVVRADGTTWTSSNYSSSIATQPWGPNNKTSIPSSVNSIFATKTVTNIVVNADGTVEFDFMGGNTNECHLEFANPVVGMTVGGTQTNALSGIPTGYDGRVTYSSSNTAVATVNATTGAVTAKAMGTAVITATATTTANYVGGTQSYTVIVRGEALSATDLPDGAIVQVSNYYGLGSLVSDGGTIKVLGGSQAAVDAAFTDGRDYNTAYATGFDATNNNHLWKVTTAGGKKYLVNAADNGRYISIASPTTLTTTATAATFSAVGGLTNVYTISTTNGQYMSASVFKAVTNNILSNYSPNGATFTHTVSNYSSAQTLHITADLSNCSGTNENILSLGNSISAWDGMHVHMYYTKSTKALQIWFLNNVAAGGERVDVTLSSNTLDVTLKDNVLTVNGTAYTVGAHAQLAGLTALSTIEVGSLEGSTRSRATKYNISVTSGEDSQYPVSAITTQDASTAWALYSAVVDEPTPVDPDTLVDPVDPDDVTTEEITMALKQVENGTTTKYVAATAAPSKGDTRKFIITSANGWWAMTNNTTATVAGPGWNGTTANELIGTGIVDADSKPYTFTYTSEGYLKRSDGQYLNANKKGASYNLSADATGSTSWTLTSTTFESHTAYTFAMTSGKDTRYLASPTANNGALTLANSGAVNIWIEQSTTTYTDAPPFTFSIKADYATIYCADAYKMPGSDLVGYFIKDASENGGRLTPVARYESGDIVPAETALLLSGRQGTYEAMLYEAKPDGAEIATVYSDANANQLEGTRDASSFTASSRGDVLYYKLTWKDSSNHDAGIGFFWGATDGAAFKLTNSYTAYLAVSKTAASNMRGFMLPDIEGRGVITAIENMEQADDTTANANVYTLSGQRMNSHNLPAGIYVMNGRKLIIK